MSSLQNYVIISSVARIAVQMRGYFSGMKLKMSQMFTTQTTMGLK